MSEQQNENQPQAQSGTNDPNSQATVSQGQPSPQSQDQSSSGEQSSAQSIPLVLVKRETGATHYVDGGARTDVVRHGETGEPEQEYALLATIDGVEVPLQTWNAGRIDTVVAAGKRAQSAAG